MAIQAKNTNLATILSNSNYGTKYSNSGFWVTVYPANSQEDSRT